VFSRTLAEILERCDQILEATFRWNCIVGVFCRAALIAVRDCSRRAVQSSVEKSSV